MLVLQAEDGDGTHYAAGLVQVDIMLAMIRKVPVIGITARVLGEYVEEVMFYSPGYEPGKQVMMVVEGRVCVRT